MKAEEGKGQLWTLNLGTLRTNNSGILTSMGDLADTGILRGKICLLPRDPGSSILQEDSAREFLWYVMACFHDAGEEVEKGVLEKPEIKPIPSQSI